MLPIGLLFAIAGAYLLLMFLIAYRVEHLPGAFATRRVRQLVYLLALGGVWMTGWSYLSVAGGLIEKGLPFLAVQIGACLTFLFGWPLILRAVQIARAHRVTTLPEFLAVRFGGSRILPALAAIILITGSVPYIALQLGAVALSFRVLATGSGGEPFRQVLALTLVLAVFTILFGARRADPTQRHEGLVVTLALHAGLKLIALAAVAALALWRFPHPFADPTIWPHLTIGSTPENTFPNWMGYLLLSMGAVVMLPFIFHVCVVENTRAADVCEARWAFPLYVLVFYLLVIPVALGGLLIGLAGPEGQAAILVLPRQAGSISLALLAYLGVIAAAGGMAVVMVLALTNIVMIDLLLPVLMSHVSRLGPYLLPLRWGIILAISLLAYGTWAFTDVDFLAQFGLVSFIAAAQLAPAFFLGLLWPGLSRRAVTWGLALSAVLCLYTAFLPNFAGKIPPFQAIVAHGPWGIGWLRPTSLFGMAGLDPYAHSAFWCMAANLGAILLYSLWHPLSPEREQRARALLSGDERPLKLRHHLLEAISFSELEAVLGRFLGAEQARGELAGIRRNLEAIDLPLETRQMMARQAVERALSGPLGSVAASVVIQQHFPISDQPLPDAMEALQTMEEALALSRADLLDRLKEMAVLNAVAEKTVAERDPERLLSGIGELLHESFQFDVVGTLLVEDGRWRLGGGYGFTATGDRPVEIPEGSVLEATIRSGRASILAPPLTTDPLDPFMGSEDLKTLVYVPISLPESVIGVLVCGIRGSPRHISADFQDLMQAIASELALAIANALHRQREDLIRKQLAVTLDNLADAVGVVGVDGRLILVNEAFARLVQLGEKESLPGMGLKDVLRELDLRDLEGRPIPSEQSAAFRAFGGQKAELQACVTGREGRRRVICVSSVPIFGADGAVIQVVSVVRDITELYHLQADLERRVGERTEDLARERNHLRSANQKLERAIEDLRSLDKIKGTFLNAVSHDLRIPLTGIVGYAEFLEDEIGGGLTADQRGFVQQILLAAARMTRLLNELLDFARMEAGKFKLDLMPVAYPTLLEQVREMFRPAVEKKGLEFRLEAAPELPEIQADPDRLVQILSNLFSNAIKFTPPGGRITVRAFPLASGIGTEVSDSGVGIPPDALPHMFERFYQTEAGRQAGGTGLGLSIVKSLVEAHGGTVSVDSEVGQGTTFRFTLPVGPRVLPSGSAGPGSGPGPSPGTP